MRFLFAAAPLLLITAAIGQAGTLNFRYDTGSGILAGTMTGTLKGDNNTFVVSSMTETWNGSAGPTLIVQSWDIYSSWSHTEVPTVTLDGSYMDFYAATAVGGDAIIFSNGDLAAQDAGQSYFSTDGFFGGHNQTFSAASWTSTTSGGAPEPGTLSLGLAAAVLATALSCRKRLARQ